MGVLRRAMNKILGKAKNQRETLGEIERESQDKIHIKMTKEQLVEDITKLGRHNATKSFWVKYVIGEKNRKLKENVRNRQN